MKYRIKQIGDRYYPQYKSFIFWHNFLKFQSGGYYTKICYYSYLEAYDFITNAKLNDELIKNTKEREKFVKIWEIE